MGVRLMLHGATDLGSSNFGDFLYAAELYRFLKESPVVDMVDFYNPSDYFRRFVPEYVATDLSVGKTDAAVYMPGGYFGEGHHARIRDNILHFYRFMPFGLRCLQRRLPLCVIAIGAGPLHSWLLRNTIKRIVRNCQLVSVRDGQSLECLKALGRSDVVNAGDMILAMNFLDMAHGSDQIDSALGNGDDRPVLLVHYNHSAEGMRLFGDAIGGCERLKSRFRIIVSSDQVLANDLDLFNEFKVAVPDAVHFQYGDPYEFLGLLEKVDVVLTTKLHVGVVGSMLSKSVISVAVHPEKTSRYYLDIGHPERHVALDKASSADVRRMLFNYGTVPVLVPKALKTGAEEHWGLLSRFVDRCSVGA